MKEQLSPNERPIIVVAGSTASGKSEIALAIARRFDGEVINADSRQVYRGMVIGTSSPTADLGNSPDVESFLCSGIPHHLYNFIDAYSQYNIAQFRKDVDLKISQMDEGKLPILTGGSGLYIDSYISNYSIEEAIIDDARRETLDQMSVTDLQKQLTEEQLDSLNDSDRGNRRRLIRLIEGREKNGVKGNPKEHLYLVVEKDREEIDEAINKRTRRMIKEGLVEENRTLLGLGYKYGETPALNTIGYKEFAGYFEGEKSLEESEAEISLHTRQYAKRQRTWFRRHKDAIRVKDEAEAIEAVEKYLKRIKQI